MPDLADQTALVEQIRTLVQGLKSCTFDLQNRITVDVSRADQAKVEVQGTSVSYDANGGDGWHMVTASQLELVGSACALWQKPESTLIHCDFPCEIINGPM